jgi:hypothetical protein
LQIPILGFFEVYFSALSPFYIRILGAFVNKYQKLDLM